LGIALAAFDAYDASIEKTAVEGLVLPTSEPTATVWYNGHWGFQYYCDTAGMKPVVPRVSMLMPGDVLVFPTIPDDYGFYRPYHGGAKFKIDDTCCEVVTDVKYDDPIPTQTVPDLYGGVTPLAGRDDPRLRVVVYRIIKRWQPDYAE
jgi:hypothetical protein